MSLGLLSYQAITGIVAGRTQSELRAELRELGAVGTSVPEVTVDATPGEEVLDFDSWKLEDRAYWTRLEEGGLFGRLVIGRIDVDSAVVKGVSPNDLRRGPGWIGYTDLPGPTGMVGLSGHRTTYGAPFRRLDDLRVGDFVDFYSPYRRYRYQVADKLIVTPDRTDVVAHTKEPRLSLTACHPPYSARFRLVVACDLVEVVRLKSTTPAPQAGGGT